MQLVARYHVMWCDVTWRDVMWCDMASCIVMWCVTWCDVVWCDVMRCEVLCCHVMCCTIMCDLMWCHGTWCEVMQWDGMFCGFDVLRSVVRTCAAMQCACLIWWLGRLCYDCEPRKPMTAKPLKSPFQCAVRHTRTAESSRHAATTPYYKVLLRPTSKTRSNYDRHVCYQCSVSIL